MDFERYYEPTTEDLQEWAAVSTAQKSESYCERGDRPMTTDRFRPDNTEGYSLAQLAELNRRYKLRLAILARQMDLDNSMEDWTAEIVQSEYDTEAVRRINSTNWNARPGPGVYGEYGD